MKNSNKDNLIGFVTLGIIASPVVLIIMLFSGAFAPSEAEVRASDERYLADIERQSNEYLCEQSRYDPDLKRFCK